MVRCDLPNHFLLRANLPRGDADGGVLLEHLGAVITMGRVVRGYVLPPLGNVGRPRGPTGETASILGSSVRVQ